MVATNNHKRCREVWEDFYKKQRERRRFKDGKFHLSHTQRKTLKRKFQGGIDSQIPSRSVVEVAMDICLSDEFNNFQAAAALDPIVQKNL